MKVTLFFNVSCYLCYVSDVEGYIYNELDNIFFNGLLWWIWIVFRYVRIMISDIDRKGMVVFIYK